MAEQGIPTHRQRGGHGGGVLCRERPNEVHAPMHPAQPPDSHPVLDCVVSEPTVGELRSGHYDVLASGHGQRAEFGPLSRHFVRFPETTTPRSNEMPP